MRTAAILLGVLTLVGCGGHRTSAPEDVVRAWSAALDQNDNQAAALLFADGAQVIQNGEETLRTHADALRWNSGLPCGGEITQLETRGRGQVLAVFTLDERPGHSCDAPGSRAAALFQVEGGKIVLWHQTDVPAEPAPGELA